MKPFIRVETKTAKDDLQHLKSQLSHKEVAKATRMAINDSIRKCKTQAKAAITEIYNIKAARVNDPNKKKGLSIKPATDTNLTAELHAGHKPISLSETKISFKGKTIANKISFKKGKAVKGKAVQRSISQITVEVKKGSPHVLPTAFTIGVGQSSGGKQFATAAIFARGKKGKPTFKFGKDRYPIDTLSTISVATAVMNTSAQERYGPVVTQHMDKRMEHHLKRQIEKIHTHG